MRKKVEDRRLIMTSLIGLVCLGAGQPAFAEEAASAAGAVQDNAAQGDTGFADIIVTARRTEESLQSVPVAITAIQPETLSRNNITTFQDLIRVVPSLGTFSPYTTDTFIVLRAQGGLVDTGVPAVTNYLNEVPLPGFVGGPGLFYDLENVQVLKGAQGTLFGRNSTGGAVLFQTARASNEVGGYFQLGLGNYDNREVQGALNLPLVDDKVMLRVAFNFQDRDGWARIIRTPNHPNGIDVNDRNVKAGRATLTLRPFDGFENTTIVDAYHFKSHGDNVILRAVNPAFFDSLAGSFGPQLAEQFKQAFLSRLAQQQALGNRRLIPSSIDTPTFKKSLAVINTTTLELSENLTLKNIAAYVTVKNRKPFEGDGTDIAHLDFGPALTDDKTSQYTEELQLQGRAADGKLKYTVGAFYLKVPKPPFYILDRLTFFGFAANQEQKRLFETSKAVFGQATYEVVSGLNLTAGVRYTKDRRTGQTRALEGAGANTFCAVPTPGAPANDPCFATKTAKSSQVTGNLSADYQIDDRTLIYVAARKGYRAGGPNTQAILPENATFKPERLTDFEVGVKSDFDLGSVPVRANLALYHSRVKGLQISQTIIEAPRPTTTLSAIRNVPHATVTGAELEVQARLTPEFTLGLSGTYTDLDVVLPPDFVRGGTPKYRYGINGAYTRELPGGAGEIAITADWNWQSKQYKATTIPDPNALQEAYGLFNATVAWNNVFESRIDLTAYVTNLFDKVYAVGEYGLYPNLGYGSDAMGEARMYGLRARYSF